MPSNGVPLVTVSVNGGSFDSVANGDTIDLGLFEVEQTAKVTVRLVDTAPSSVIMIVNYSLLSDTIAYDPNPPLLFTPPPVQVVYPGILPGNYELYDIYVVLNTSSLGEISGSITYSLSSVDPENETFIVNFTGAVSSSASSRLLGSAKLNSPSLLYPNGGEQILTRSIEIAWTEPSVASPDGLEAWYEIFYSDNYDFATDPDWIAIAASIPIGTNRFLWNVGNTFKSNNMRIGLRTVNVRGKRSDMSISAESFTIRRSSPLTPAILSPVPQSRYGNSIDIIFDDAAVVNQYGQKARYYVYFRSIKANVPLTCVVQNIPVGSGPIKWDTSLLAPSDDYEVIAYLADDSGDKSEEVVVSPIAIYNEGFFLIDTMPPSGYVQINNGDEFTKERDVSVRLFSYDGITGIHSMRFFESAETGEETGGPPESYTNLKYWQLSENDGVKTLKVVFQDFGANRTTEIVKPFRILFDLNNSDIADIIFHRDISGQSIIWAGVNGTTPSIYNFSPNGSLVASVNEPINSLAIYNDSLFISVNTSDDTALVYRYVGLNQLLPTIELSDHNSEIISMQSYKTSLYLGAASGSLYRYDDNSVNLVTTFSSPVHVLYSDSSLLYILLRNSNTLIIFDGTTFKEVIVR